MSRSADTAPLLGPPRSIFTALPHGLRNLAGPLHTGARLGPRAGPRPLKPDQVLRRSRAPPVKESDGRQEHAGSSVGEPQLEAPPADGPQAEGHAGVQVAGDLVWPDRIRERIGGLEVQNLSAVSESGDRRVRVKQVNLQGAGQTGRLRLLSEDDIQQQTAGVFTLHPLAQESPGPAAGTRLVHRDEVPAL